MRAPRRRSRAVLFTAVLFICAAWPALAQDSHEDAAIFRSGTRLVEVDVVVRDKNGPVKGLTKDDFTLWDCKSNERSLYDPTDPCRVKRQPLEVFREIDEASAAPAVPLRSGAVSNRVYSDGKPVTSATVVLFDQVNTPFNLKGYQRDQVVKFLTSIGDGNDDGNHIALYSLGRSLHILQDFTDDPKKLIQAVSKLDPGTQMGPPSDPSDGPEISGMESEVFNDMKREVTVEAIQKIIRHLDGLPGRKNL